MKKQSSLITTLILFSIIISCSDCDDSITCPPFSDEAKQYLTYDNGDVITYVNELGAEMNFTIDNKTFSESTIIECKKAKGICQCPSIFLDCRPTGTYSGRTEDGRKVIKDTVNDREYEYDYLQYRVQTRLNNESDIQNIYFNLIDIRGGFDFTPEFNLGDNQILLEEFTAGNKTYNNVVKQYKDLEQNDNLDSSSNIDFISEIYVQPEIGIIAFFDLESNSMFYLKN